MKKQKVQNVLKHIVCILLCLTVVLPFSNYAEVIKKGNLIQGFANSLLYALVATTLGVVLCAMAAFVMCRNRTKLNTFLYYFVLCGLFFPVNYVTLVRVLSALNLNLRNIHSG